MAFNTKIFLGTFSKSIIFISIKDRTHWTPLTRQRSLLVLWNLSEGYVLGFFLNEILLLSLQCFLCWLANKLWDLLTLILFSSFSQQRPIFQIQSAGSLESKNSGNYVLIENFASPVPPEIHQLSNITANEGDSKSLKCTATGFPLPKVIWFRDNKEYPGQMVGSDMDTCLNLYFIGFRYKTFFYWN